MSSIGFTSCFMPRNGCDPSGAFLFLNHSQAFTAFFAHCLVNPPVQLRARSQVRGAFAPLFDDFHVATKRPCVLCGIEFQAANDSQKSLTDRVTRFFPAGTCSHCTPPKHSGRSPHGSLPMTARTWSRGQVSVGPLYAGAGFGGTGLACGCGTIPLRSRSRCLRSFRPHSCEQ